MINFNSKNIIFSTSVRFLQNSNSTILIDGKSGTWIILDDLFFSKIIYCINNKISPSVYINKEENINCRADLIQIFETLMEENILVDSTIELPVESIKEVEFKITNKCNLFCAHCAACSEITKTDFLSTKDIILILDKIFSSDIDTIILTGGEPLIRGDINIILEYARKNFSGTINLITNGTLINKELAYVLKANVDAVSISLDGYDKISTELIRGAGSLKKLCRG